MIDALGNELVIGNNYGYTISKNGFQTVIIGELVKINKFKVTLNVIEKRKYLYNDLKEEIKTDKPKTVSIYSINLFPVNIKTEKQKLQDFYKSELPNLPLVAFNPVFMKEEDYINNVKSSELYTDNNFMKLYYKYRYAPDEIVNSAIIYILDNYKKITDWSELEFIVYDNKEKEYVEYFNKYLHNSKGMITDYLNKIHDELGYPNKEQRHNPIESITKPVLDPTDGDFSITINDRPIYWLSGDVIIKIADYIENNIK